MTSFHSTPPIQAEHGWRLWGHEHQFPPPRLSGRCGIRKLSFAGNSRALTLSGQALTGNDADGVLQEVAGRRDHFARGISRRTSVGLRRE
jgi:hypothetical protein